MSFAPRTLGWSSGWLVSLDSFWRVLSSFVTSTVGKSKRTAFLPRPSGILSELCIGFSNPLAAVGELLYLLESYLESKAENCCESWVFKSRALFTPALTRLATAIATESDTIVHLRCAAFLSGEDPAPEFDFLPEKLTLLLIPWGKSLISIFFLFSRVLSLLSMFSKTWSVFWLKSISFWYFLCCLWGELFTLNRSRCCTVASGRMIALIFWSSWWVFSWNLDR